MFRELLLGIGIGGIIFTKKGKDIVKGPTNVLKKYIMEGITNTDIVQMGKEFLKGYNDCQSETINTIKDDFKKDIKNDDNNENNLKGSKDINKREIPKIEAIKKY